MLHRKLAAPDCDETQSPLLFVKELHEKSNLLSSDDLRGDGRSRTEIRSVTIYSNVSSHVTGSAYIELGGTKVVGVVQGPKPKDSSKGEEYIMEGAINCQLKWVPFAKRFRQNPKQESGEKHLSNMIGQAIKALTLHELYPKLQIDISLQVLEDDGSVLTCAVLCAAVAMVTGGIHLKDIPIACKVSCGDSGHFLCDPCSSEEYDPVSSTHMTPTEVVSGDVSVIYAPSLRELIGIHQSGVMDLDTCSKGVEICMEGCVKIRQRVKEYLELNNK